MPIEGRAWQYGPLLQVPLPVPRVWSPRAGSAVELPNYGAIDDSGRGLFFLCLCLAVDTADQSTLRGRVSPARRGSPLMQSSMAVCSAAVYEKMLRQSSYPGQRCSYEAICSRAPIPQAHLREMGINSALKAPLYAWPCQSVG